MVQPRKSAFFEGPEPLCASAAAISIGLRRMASKKTGCTHRRLRGQRGGGDHHAPRLGACGVRGPGDCAVSLGSNESLACASEWMTRRQGLAH